MFDEKKMWCSLFNGRQKLIRPMNDRKQNATQDNGITRRLRWQNHLLFIIAFLTKLREKQAAVSSFHKTWLYGFSAEFPCLCLLRIHAVLSAHHGKNPVHISILAYHYTGAFICCIHFISRGISHTMIVNGWHSGADVVWLMAFSDRNAAISG